MKIENRNNIKILVDGKEVIPDENNIIRLPENAKILQYSLKSKSDTPTDKFIDISGTYPIKSTSKNLFNNIIFRSFLASTGSITQTGSGETIISNCNGYYSSKTGWHSNYDKKKKKKKKMQNNNLIPLSDFVLERVDKISALQLANEVVGYTKFLKQPLKLEMFTGENKLFEGYIKNAGGYFDANGSGQSVLIDGIDFPIRLDESKTVESLVEYGLTLTPSALNKIEIKE